MNKNIKKAAILSLILLLLDGNTIEAKNFVDKETRDKYIEEQIKYFKIHPKEAEALAKSGKEIVLEKHNKSSVMDVYTYIEDIPQEVGDICYYKANVIFGKNPKELRKTNKDMKKPSGWRKGIIINICNNTNLPMGICEYDEETNTVGEFLGWASDRDVNTQMKGYAEAIENDIVADISFGNFCGWNNTYIDENGYFIEEDPEYYLPIGYEPIDETSEHGIRVHYSEKEKEGYINYGEYYISEDVYKVRSKIDPKDIPVKTLKTYGPKI